MENERLLTLLMFLGYILKILLILIPIIIILFGTIDLVKELINPSDTKNNINLFIKRLIYGVGAFLVSTIVYFLINLVDQNINSQVLKCFSDPSFCNDVISNARKDLEKCSNIDDKNKCCKFVLNNNNANYNDDIKDCSIPISSIIK